MECSSHAIDQKRIFGLKFSGAIFTNLTKDHLDYHKTMKKYALAKKTFFDSLDGKAFVIVNKDDKYSDFMVSNCKAKKYFFSIDKESNFKVKILEQNIKGIKIAIKNDILSSKLFGKYNIYNLTGIYLTSLLLKMPKNALIKEISKISPPKGRLEFVKLKNDIYGIVDYAHTPDAMLNVLKNIREIKSSNSKIITIFGCGGDRDKTKRPIMGQIAEKLSDEIIITSDNPRSEDPNSIIEEIYKGVKDKEVFKIEDRKKAIEKGISLARNGDIVMVLGKGHEKYQIYKDKTVYFSDIDVLKNNNG
jgi:UDP-N-acetylmuramoyl-L-alanyl-D-glutamate--2,6-diaminopimelate ligase